MSALPNARSLLVLHTPVDWSGKLRHLLQTWAFCAVIAVMQVAFVPERPFAPPLVFSFLIGTTSWAVVDFGRHLFPSARETGWPDLLPSFALVGLGIAAGYLLGTTTADWICRTWDLYGRMPVDPAADRRSALLITAMAGVIGTYWFYSINRGRYLERRMGEAQRHASEARLKLLETQLEPHMLFNTLANLRALIGIDPPRAQEMLDRVIAYLRATLDASRATTHPLQAEFDRLRDYLELMSIRMGPRLACELHLPPELARVPVPTLLLQPLVENAIQHGLEPRVEGGRLHVAARREGPQLVLDVLDTGVGLGGPVRGTGFGVAQVRERLATLYGAGAAFELRDGDFGGTHATIRLPLPT
ncbi:MAG TPA: histidine kinase [Ramlibacter sp.]|nr:histidine kinase [Ramlibacter sp.]